VAALVLFFFFFLMKHRQFYSDSPKFIPSMLIASAGLVLNMGLWGQVTDEHPRSVAYPSAARRHPIGHHSDLNKTWTSSLRFLCLELC
jgi:hypothetical protein